MFHVEHFETRQNRKMFHVEHTTACPKSARDSIPAFPRNDLKTPPNPREVFHRQPLSGPSNPIPFILAQTLPRHKFPLSLALID